MIFADVHGKLGVNYSRAHERGEDLLTSTVFGLLRYIPPADGFLAVLLRARPVQADASGLAIRQDRGWLNLEQVVEVNIDFWPHWPDYGEPDVLLTLCSGDHRPLALVLVEAKLYALKGGGGGEDNQLADDTSDDQLVRYWQGLQLREEVQSGAEASVIYLTRHGAPPIEELAESARRAKDEKPAMRLAWLSWRDVWEVAEGLAGTNLVAADLACLLAHKGLKNFNGFHAKPWQTPSTRRFWRPAA